MGTDLERHRFHGDFSDADTVKPVRHLAAIHFLPRGGAAVNRTPFTQARTLIVSVPEAPVEHLGEFRLERRGEFRSICPVTDSIGRLTVTLGTTLHIFCRTRPALYLEDLDTRVYDLVHKLDGTQVLGGHYIFVVNVQAGAGFEIGDLITATAELIAGSAVCRSAISLETEVALPRDGHAQCPVSEHLYTHKLTGRALDAVPQDGLVNILHLVQIQFPGQDDHIRKLGIEAQRLHIGYAQLRGDMHLHTYLTAVHYRSHIRSDDRVHAGRLRRVQCPVRRFNVFLIKDNVQCQVSLDAILPAYSDNLRQILRLEIIGRMRTHIQIADPEIYRVSTTLNGCHQTFKIARRRHYLQFLLFH